MMHLNASPRSRRCSDRRAILPFEADAPSIVDPDAPLLLAVAFELFQPVAGEAGDVTQPACNFKPIQDHFSFPAKWFELFDPFALGEALGSGVAIAQDHGETVTRIMRYVKRNSGADSA
jgi:hypothetical protein